MKFMYIRNVNESFLHLILGSIRRQLQRDFLNKIQMSRDILKVNIAELLLRQYTRGVWGS
jgi:hypothetical protein